MPEAPPPLPSPASTPAQPEDDDHGSDRDEYLALLLELARGNPDQVHLFDRIERVIEL